MMCDEWRTTVMIKRLPEGCTSSKLRDLLCLAGFRDLVDFVYVPMKFVKHLVSHLFWSLFR